MNMYVHPATDLQVAALVRQPRGTVLLHGPQGVGKRTLALDIARRLNCEGCSDGSCRSCRLAVAGNHPNVIRIEPDEKGKIGIEAVHELQRSLHYQQYERNGYRVIILAEAHTLTLPAQNALLKTLEEPPIGSLVVMTSQTPQALLPTVLSRCHLLFVAPLPVSEVETFVQSTYPDADAALIATRSRGLIGRASVLASDSSKLDEDSQLASEAERLLRETDLMARLRLAAGAAADAARRSALVDELILQTRQRARNATAGNTEVLLALERLRQRLQANVSPKTAFEAFAVELP